MSSFLSVLEHAARAPATGWKTGYPTLDDPRVLGGLVDRRLYICAARPEVGKTTWALNVCRNVAKQSSRPVAFVSTEMPDTEIAVHLLSIDAGVEKVAAQKMLEDPATLMKYTTNYEINSEGPMSWPEIEEWVSTIDHPSMLCVDHMDNITNTGAGNGETARLNAAARQAKDVAMRMGIPVLLIHHISRSGDDGEFDYGDRPVHAGRLNYGGEKQADVVLGCWRPAQNPKAVANEREFRVGVAKNRYGMKLPYEGLKLTWHRPTLLITED